MNAALWKQLQLSPVERVAFKGADGWDVDGFFMKPVGWEAGKKYPMILTIHGGPAGMFGFDWYHEFQVYASHGWAVFFTNPSISAVFSCPISRCCARRSPRSSPEMSKAWKPPLYTPI